MAPDSFKNLGFDDDSGSPGLTSAAQTSQAQNKDKSREA
jgi:hypothetical protein